MKKLELTKEQGQTVRNFLNNYYTEYKDNNDRLPFKTQMELLYDYTFDLEK